MHEATIAGSERIGHNTSGGIEIATSSRIEIMVSGYRQSPASVDAWNRSVPDLPAALDELPRSAVELGDDATVGVPCRSTVRACRPAPISPSTSASIRIPDDRGENGAGRAAAEERRSS